MASDTTRHAGLGLHNRRVQVRFLSHLPLSPEFMGAAATWLQPILRALTPFDPNGSSAGRYISVPQLVIDARVLQALYTSSPDH